MKCSVIITGPAATLILVTDMPPNHIWIGLLLPMKHRMRMILHPDPGTLSGMAAILPPLLILLILWMGALGAASMKESVSAMCLLKILKQPLYMHPKRKKPPGPHRLIPLGHFITYS